MLELVEKQSQQVTQLLETQSARRLFPYQLMSPEEKLAFEEEVLKEKNEFMLQLWSERRKLRAKMRKDDEVS